MTVNAYPHHRCGPANEQKLRVRRSAPFIDEEGRDLSIRSVPGLDQGPQSGQHRDAAGAEREVEQVIGAIFLHRNTTTIS
jgi:hypothetical protein